MSMSEGMKLVADLHTHTLASGHAYQTIREMAQAAAGKGIELFGITEHGVVMPGTCDMMYFENLRLLERTLYGVEILFGVELNILDFWGTVDMDENYLKEMDVTVASLHDHCIRPGSREENTSAYLEAIKNPYVNIIGHPDDGKYPVDYLALVQAAGEYRVLLEVNNSSLHPRCARLNSEENIATMLDYCAKYRVPIIIDSDSHTDSTVGRHDYAEALMKKIGFPEELVVNRSAEETKKYVNKYKYK